MYNEKYNDDQERWGGKVRVKTLQTNATEKATENLDSIQANGRCDPNEIWG